LNSNYALIKNQIRRFCFEKLKNNQEPIERFEELNLKNNAMIQNALKPQLISAAIIYSYLREKKLNGRSGITTKIISNWSIQIIKGNTIS